MEIRIHTLVLAIPPAGAAIIFLLSIPSVIALVAYLRDGQPKLSGYQDKDGIATEQAVEAYSAQIPKILICTCASLGFVASTALAVVITIFFIKDGDGYGYGNFLGNWFAFASSVSIGLPRAINTKPKLTISSFVSWSKPQALRWAGIRLKATLLGSMPHFQMFRSSLSSSSEMGFSPNPREITKPQPPSNFALQHWCSRFALQLPVFWFRDAQSWL